jgi:hypothetical protein
LASKKERKSKKNHWNDTFQIQLRGEETKMTSKSVKFKNLNGKRKFNEDVGKKKDKEKGTSY